MKSSLDNLLFLWASRIINKRTNDCSLASQANVIISDKVVYSYRTSVPIAIYLGKRYERGEFLINVDHYSKTTSQQQAAIENAIAITGGLMHRTSFSLMREIAPPEDIDLEDIIDFTEYESIAGWVDDDRVFENDDVAVMEYKRHDFTPDKPIETKIKNNTVWVKGKLRIEPAFLLRLHGSDEGYTALFDTDKHTYRYRILAKEVETTEAAFLSLEPTKVTNSYINGYSVLKHGDFYFVPFRMKNKYGEFEHVTVARYKKEHNMQNWQFVKEFELKPINDETGAWAKIQTNTSLCYGDVSHKKNGIADPLFTRISLLNNLYTCYRANDIESNAKKVVRHFTHENGNGKIK